MTTPHLNFSKWTSYSREELIVKIRSQMKEKRFQHCLRVEAKAIELAEKYHVSKEKAALAGLIHDYAKERPIEELRQLAKSNGLDPIYYGQNSEILHGPVGAILIQKELGIHDLEIQEALKQHTIGGEEMSVLSKVLFIADYIEEGRNFEGVEEARFLADIDLDLAVQYKIEHTLQYLIISRQYIFPKTLSVYNVLVAKN